LIDQDFDQCLRKFISIAQHFVAAQVQVHFDRQQFDPSLAAECRFDRKKVDN